MAFLDDVKKGLTDVSETIVKKSTELVEIQKLKMKKTSLESDIKRDYALLGKLYFAKMEADGTQGETPEAAEYFERIVQARDAVEEVKLQISKLNHEKSCRACGAKVSMDTIYCPKCGTRFEDEDETEEDVESPSEETSEAAQPESEASDSAQESEETAATDESAAEETSEENEADEAPAPEEGEGADCRSEEKSEDSVQ